jgi:hypothetical protein
MRSSRQGPPPTSSSVAWAGPPRPGRRSLPRRDPPLPSIGRRRASGCEEYRVPTGEPIFPYLVEVVAANDINDSSLSWCCGMHGSQWDLRPRAGSCFASQVSRLRTSTTPAAEPTMRIPRQLDILGNVVPQFGFAYLWVEVLGRSGRHLAQALHIRPGSVYKGARRGREEGAHWRNVAGIYQKATKAAT